MKKSLCIVLAMLAIAMLTACTPPPANQPEGGADSGAEAKAVSELVANDDFMLAIEVSKDVYKADEEITCHATLTYMGGEPLTALHSDPLLVFYIEGGNFSGDWARQDSLNRTTFQPGDEMRVAFAKSGGYSADDPNADFFEAYYKETVLRLPAGQYTLSAQIEYATDENDMRGTMQTLDVSAAVTVTD